ncbi:MAG: YraN family protein [Gammaproteobacteria bacterium]|nr:YraN family protein [Gammaproteobacteria bacterium]
MRGPPSASTSATGARAEDAALRFLVARGLRLVARNFRCGGGEIDLVMLEGQTLVVVEVRYRCNQRLVDPALTVTAAKRRRLLHAAASFLQRHPAHAARALRFDVMALSGGPDAPACRWIRRAFDGNDTS